MLAGRPPFDGETAMDLVVAHMNEPPPPLSQHVKVPKALEQVVMRMLEKDPANRPTLEDFRSIIADPQRPSRRLTPLPTRLTTQPRAFPVAKPTPRWPIALAALAAVGIGVGTWKLVGGSSEPAKPPPPPPPVQPVAAPVPPPAPPAPPPVPERGTLSVNVTGAKDAVILVDGTDRGHGTEVRIELDAGHHDITVKPAGRAPITQGVDLGAGDNSSVTVVVPPVPVVRTPPRRQTHKAPKPPQDDDALLRPGRH
jgi:serine/threonine-protein kinase